MVQENFETTFIVSGFPWSLYHVNLPLQVKIMLWNVYPNRLCINFVIVWIFFQMSKGAEYNGMWGDWAVVGDDTSNSLLPGPAPAGEYCDSGVDGVGSRSDYYDDMFGDYDGEYENFSGIGFTFTGITNANDTDYGQFQDATSLSGCDSSSTSGKQAKNCKKRCFFVSKNKYVVFESCDSH